MCMNILLCRHVVRHLEPQCDVHKDESVEKKSLVTCICLQEFDAARSAWNLSKHVQSESGARGARPFSGWHAWIEAGCYNYDGFQRVPHVRNNFPNLVIARIHVVQAFRSGRCFMNQSARSREWRKRWRQKHPSRALAWSAPPSSPIWGCCVGTPNMSTRTNGLLDSHPVGYSGSPSTVNETNCNKKEGKANL